jgi:glycogen debranching enzyme
MTDIVRIRDKYYVRATSALADDRVRILKYGGTLAVLNRFGDVEAAGFNQMGIFHKETRHLSRCTLQLNGTQPLLLNSALQQDNAVLSVDLANSDIPLKSGGTLPREVLHLFRSKFVFQDTCYDEMRITNHGTDKVQIRLAILFDADFVDVFEIRGTKRRQRGQQLEDLVGRDSVVLSYMGLDNILRRTRLQFTPAPHSLLRRVARYELTLQPRQETFILLSVCCEQQNDASPSATHQDAHTRLLDELKSRHSQCRIRSSALNYDSWFVRSRDDLELLTIGNPEGAVPYAGVPWFNTVFGRDSIITSLETLWMTPEVAKAVLQHLAASQAIHEDAERDSQPGKILHEMRRGEMANTREVPFGCYYGSVDSTPLFVVLAGAYFERTGDLNFVRNIWPNIDAALEWIDRYGDVDADGFVEYSRQSKEGLVQQGWKDSHDSIFHADGEIAKPPIALCEVQAYTYAAKRVAASMARELGQHTRARQLEEAAEKLRIRFEAVFWDGQLGTYAIALDGNKRRCCINSSNAGQTLFCGIASAERARQVRNELMTSKMFSGWGVRTVSSAEIRYNPMSYHNGSVWPHDNALIGLGLASYGYQRDAARLLRSMKEVSDFIELRRLPELFCGFHKRDDASGPTMYPVACSPQAWSAGAAFLLVRAALGIEVRGRDQQVRFVNANLPDDLDEIVIENLRVGDGVLNIVARRRARGVVVETLRKEGRIAVETT